MAKKGFLLIDGMKNVLLIHTDEYEMVKELLRKDVYASGESVLRRVKQHKTLPELDKTVRLYLKGEYDDELAKSDK